tara:strand:- start:67 stop:603 length:537 start_codon:yes stop_codon:yes gene_type:complete
MENDAEKMREKYGSWAQFMTESEAKSMLRDYGKVMEIMKGFLEEAFGEGHSYSIDDGDAGGLSYEGGGLNISGDLDGVASYQATLRNDSTDIMFSFSYDLHKLDCDANQISSEIQELEDDTFDYPGYSEPVLEVLDEDEWLTCNWIVHVGPLFDGVPKINEIIDFDNRVNEIINSHKK